MSKTGQRLIKAAKEAVEMVQPVKECQATFKEHCTYPKCDCDRERKMAEWKFEKYDHLQDAVKRFLEILNTKEINGEGNEFRPTNIRSCRVYDTAEMEDILKQMEVMSGYRQQKEMKDWNI